MKNTLYNLHIAAAGLHFISCVFSFIFHTNTIYGKITVPVNNLETSIDLNDNITHETILHINPITLVSINEALTFFSHIFALFFIYRANNLNEFENIRRFIEYSFTAGILQVALFLSMSSSTLFELFTLIILNIIIQFLGFVYEKIKENNIKSYLMTAAFALLILEIIYVVLQSFNIKGVDKTAYIVMTIIYALFYLTFGFVKLLWKEHENEIFILLSVSSKISLSWILIANVYSTLKDLNVKSIPTDHTQLDWRLLQYIISIFSTLILIIGIPNIINNNVGRKNRKNFNI